MSPIYLAMLWKWLRGGFVVVVALLLVATAADACVMRHHSTKVRFAKLHACPSTGLNKLPCPGYVIDHKKSLACRGRDSVANMQWQTIAEGKAKDRIERLGCAKKAAP